MMSTFVRFGACCAVAIGSAAMIGCDETVKKDETVRTNADGSQTKTKEEVTKDSEGKLKTEMSKEQIPASQVNH